MHGINSLKKKESGSAGFWIYMIYISSFFLHLGARIDFLGLIRFDMILVVILFLALISAGSTKSIEGEIEDRSSKFVLAILIYSIISIPFVEWPGTVLKSGLEELIKAIIFYFFTVNFVNTEKKLQTLIFVFLACNTFRVLEPLYLNYFEGYWGSKTTFGWDQVERLSGGPFDVINSNGLAFLIASLLPFFHFILGAGSKIQRYLYISLLPLFLYAMALTLSRSGIIAVVFIYGIVILRSKRKAVFISLASIAAVIFIFTLNAVQRDRYLSIFDEDTKSAASADGRIEGLGRDLEVALHRPIFGHGLGASLEANFNVAGVAKISHNLWLETWQELGLIGLVILVVYITSVLKNFHAAKRLVSPVLDEKDYLVRCLNAMQVWMYMNLLFSMASYGLKSYEWYLFGGLSLVIARIAHQKVRYDQRNRVPSQEVRVIQTNRVNHG